MVFGVASNKPADLTRMSALGTDKLTFSMGQSCTNRSFYALQRSDTPTSEAIYRYN